MVRDFDYNEFPLAYLITVRCYGTWLHGDKRGSMNRQDNAFGTPRVPPNSQLQYFEIKELKHPAVTFNAHQRGAVRRAIREVCAHREYHLRAINVRTNQRILSSRPLLNPNP
ncbi:MAG: hypothetical protein QOJ88_126 [Pyrinomonadaceae bacterium]|nr:hypothetical protein [Pyrinomonadaceae bacterium]